jgi:hypothetical protein
LKKRDTDEINDLDGLRLKRTKNYLPEVQEHRELRVQEQEHHTVALRRAVPVAHRGKDFVEAQGPQELQDSKEQEELRREKGSQDDSSVRREPERGERKAG